MYGSIDRFESAICAGKMCQTPGVRVAFWSNEMHPATQDGTTPAN